MRRLVLGLTIMAVLITGLFGIAGPASAEHGTARWLNHRFNVTFRQAAGTCAVACAYWVDAANTDLDGDGNPDVYFQACDRPFPDPATEKLRVTVGDYTGQDGGFVATLFLFAIYPLSDWDSFICATNGEELAIGANIIGELCDNILGSNSPVPFGCREFSLIKVKETDQLDLRVYNWSDVPGPVVPLQGQIAACNPFYSPNASQRPTACSKNL